MAEASPFAPRVLEGSVALITGGGSGIGLEITRQLGLHGAKVVISGRREAVLREACRQLGGERIEAHFVQGDVRAYEQCERMVAEAVARFGTLTVLVNCAAGNFLATAEQLSPNGFKTVMDIDTLGTFNMSRAAFPELSKAGTKRAGGTCIVNISATLHYGATWYQAHASAAKAAIDSLTRSLALEWGPLGVRVNGIAPGPIEGTAGLTKLAPGQAEALQALWRERIPLGRLGRTQDIALAAVFLCSGGASYVNGHTLVVDGGEWMYRQPIIPRQAVLAVSKGVEAKSRAVGVAAAAPAARSKL